MQVCKHNQNGCLNSSYLVRLRDSNPVGLWWFTKDDINDPNHITGFCEDTLQKVFWKKIFFSVIHTIVFAYRIVLIYPRAKKAGTRNVRKMWSSNSLINSQLKYWIQAECQMSKRALPWFCFKLLPLFQSLSMESKKPPFFFFTGKFLSPLGLEPGISHKPSPSLYHLTQTSKAVESKKPKHTHTQRKLLVLEFKSKLTERKSSL